MADADPGGCGCCRDAFPALLDKPYDFMDAFEVFGFCSFADPFDVEFTTDEDFAANLLAAFRVESPTEPEIF